MRDGESHGEEREFPDQVCRIVSTDNRHTVHERSTPP